MCIGKLSCFYYLFPGSTWPAVTDVLYNRTGKKINILLDDSYVIPEALKPDVTDVFSVYLNGSAGYIIESGN